MVFEQRIADIRVIRGYGAAKAAVRLYKWGRLSASKPSSQFGVLPARVPPVAAVDLAAEKAFGGASLGYGHRFIGRTRPSGSVILP